MQIKAHETPLKDRKQTSDEIKFLVRAYANDLHNISLELGGNPVPVSDLSFDLYFDFIKNLKYKRDKEPVERVGRPAWIIGYCGNGGHGLDCKKKAVMIASWLYLHGIPYRFIGSSSRKDREIHHIFPQALINGTWVNVDATYPDYHIGQEKTVTAKEIL